MQIKNVRFIIAAIATFSAYAVYVSRVNLSIAIIAMVDDQHATGAAADAGQNETASRGAGVQPAPAFRYNSSDLVAADGDSSGQLIGSSNAAAAAAAATTTTTKNNATSSTIADSSGGASRSVGASQPLANIFLKSKNSMKTPLISQEKFHWDQSEQGHILGAFFFGYILFQIPGARMAELVGAKWIIMVASLGSAVISLAFPLSTQLNSIHLVWMLRFVMGLCQSAFFPAAYCLFCRWFPERERSVLLPIMFIGSSIGSISTYITSSYLISSPSYGWPSVFYFSGWICFACALLWFVFGSNGPEDNWWISPEERKFILNNVNNQSSESNSLDGRSAASTDDSHSLTMAGSAGILTPPNHHHHHHSKQTTPQAIAKERAAAPDRGRGGPAAATAAANQNEPSWPKLIRSVPVWALILSMYGNEWSHAVLSYELPTYLNRALNFPIEQNGVINSFFQLSYAVASPIMSSLGAYLLSEHLFGMRKMHVRKLFQSLATFGQMACFVSVPICGANRGLIMMFMFLAIVFKSCCNAGDIMVAGDLSPEYAGTIFAMANSVGNTAGFVVPWLAGVLVDDPYKRVQWTPFWLITASIMCFSGVIFLVFGETRRQDFSKGGQCSVSRNEEDDEGDDEDIHLELPASKQPLNCSIKLDSNMMMTTIATDQNNNNNNYNNNDNDSYYPHHRRFSQSKTTTTT